MNPEGRLLTDNPLLRRLLISRWPQWLVGATALAVFTYLALAGIAGTPVGNRNLAITLVWIAWWGALILILVPVGGRLWCSICPLPLPGEWAQRGGLMQADGRRQLGLGRRWPRRWRNLWLQNIGFLALAIFSAPILTLPRATAWLLIALVVIALAVSLLFERRSFCRYLCPVGGFIGLYSLLSPLALRVKDPQVCRTHPTKDCYRGNALGHGCPWQVYPGTLNRNANCGLCLECLRTCPLDNVALVWRPGQSDLAAGPGRRPLHMDEVFKGAIMLAAALVYSAVMLGPWGALKAAAFNVFSAEWFTYVGGLLVLALVVVPGVLALAASIGARLDPSGLLRGREGIRRAAAGLIPLGLGAWVAFSLGFVFANGSYVLNALSDPLGWGWDLFGLSNLAWRPALTGITPLLQGFALIAGLAGAAYITFKEVLHTDRTIRSSLASVPVLTFYALCGAALMVILS
ncbi:MAG: 4Fe-4S binding protein [Anaerolineales bacterium]|nr:4Fe-4S binding protein [Anaerolineales bacterium]